MCMCVALQIKSVVNSLRTEPMGVHSRFNCIQKSVYNISLHWKASRAAEREQEWRGGGEGKSWIKMENGYRWLIVNVKGEKWRYNTKGEKEKGQPRARESNKEMSTCIHCMYEQTFKIPLHFLYFTALVWQPEVSDFKCFYCLGQWIQVLHCAFGCSGLWNLIMIDLYIENFSVLFPLSLTLLLCFLFSSLYPF